MRITLKTIAEESGFSITTVSRALAGYDDVNEETRRHIIAIAERLGYQPNLSARQLRSQQSHTIGMVIPLTPYFSDPFFMELLSGVGRQAAEHNYDLRLSAQVPGQDELNAYHRMVAGRQVDGVVLARVHHQDPRIAYLQQAQHPFVVFGRSDAEDYPYIDVDSGSGIRLLVEHFADYGHQRIALILSPRDLMFTTLRLRGYREAFESLNLPYREGYIQEGDLSQRGGLEAAERLLQLADPPTAIIACNDLMALGAMTTIQRRGLRPGQDIAVAGFDDIPAALDAEPQLTTIHQPIYQIGRQLTDMLVNLMQGNTPDKPHILLQPELIIRASSGPKR
ncbi:MAG: LacI family DNA-binding transcriptional regulator [Anaerolineae bacterium]|nr:LacI family DNA-binding transcriptional regulator [Anaerolineae bacterium]